MAGPDRHSITGVDRRTSMRYSMHYDQNNDNDDYDLAAMGISDGFRPSDVGHHRILSQASQHRDRPLGRRTPPPIPPPRPSSTTKPKFDSFALRHDGVMGPVPARSSAIVSSNQPPSRSSSVSSGIPLRSESPYLGPTGPSHPYQMYPQESRLLRTMSVATTSTIQVPERSYSGPSGPTHPYGMYPQNTAPEVESVHDAPVNSSAPVGFPGLNNNYQRRLGPEGEEIADIIGPDGHTEQLPPYTQYPDEAFARKARPMVQLPIAGAGGMGLATRNPEFESREDLYSPPSRQSTRSLMSDSAYQLNPEATPVSEKPELKKWQKVARRKVCGIIPVWAILLTASVIIVFAIVLASLFVALKPKHKHNGHFDKDGGDQQPQYASVTTTFDATPYTTVPTGLASLPTGTFRIPLFAPSTVESGCILDTAQSDAWSCSVQQNLPYQITVSDIPGSEPLSDNEVMLSFGNNSMTFFPYGAQPPILSQAQVLSLVTDSQNPGRGPSWFFQTPYTKVVILPAVALSPPSSSKRAANARGQSKEASTRKGVAQVGDMPWFCYWNSTLLEAFIYINQTSSAGCQSNVTSSPSFPTSTSTYPSGVPSTAVQSPSYPSAHTADPQLAGYPKVVKVEERRIPRGSDSIPPYCIQHIINSDGSSQPLLNSTGQPVTIYLNETDSTSISPISGRQLLEALPERDENLIARESASNCGCVWLVT